MRPMTTGSAAFSCFDSAVLLPCFATDNVCGGSAPAEDVAEIALVDDCVDGPPRLLSRFSDLPKSSNFPPPRARCAAALTLEPLAELTSLRGDFLEFLDSFSSNF